ALPIWGGRRIPRDSTDGALATRLVDSEESRDRGPDEPGGEGGEADDREEEDRLTRARDAALGLAQGEREDRDPQQETGEESDQNGGTELVDQDEAGGEPPEDRIGTRDVHAQAGRIGLRVLLRLRLEDTRSASPRADRVPGEVRQHAGPEEGDDGDPSLDADDRGVREDGYAKEDRVRGRRSHPDEESGAPRSRDGLGRDDRVHRPGRCREREADAGAGDGRPDDVPDHR